jgi:tRNA (Thr-GGU) A37 N-methylase
VPARPRRVIMTLVKLQAVSGDVLELAEIRVNC